MRILAFDTATRATTVALCGLGGRRPPQDARDDPPAGTRPRHANRLMPLIVEVLERAGCTWSELDLIAVGVGPGTFTGLRIGIATANALGRARGIPLAGVSTLRSLALGGAAAGDVDAILAVIDARRGEVFAAAWRARGGELADDLLAPSALAPETLASLLPRLGSTVRAVGDGAVEFKGVLERSGVLVPEDGSDLHRVTAINHCALAGRLPEGGTDEIRPEYLRLPDAEIARRAAGSS
ncbi:MAG TPA: tRNA (adenosine(37)-N6)-threonylcarbamoyltransferase complex dimerization subunit type 1 TsaB [Solirubrobacteraceae bacterium]|nr:tRNA (adenosine(37)-N6)-threonylcarbamoyltransferase complex dimerization subunit type 1 TsaB [Solirubrobacteraceae bacterium]